MDQYASAHYRTKSDNPPAVVATAGLARRTPHHI